MRIPVRSKKTTLWVVFGIVVVTMFLFKFTELRPTCLFRDDTQSQMVREGKFIMDSHGGQYSYSREMPLIFIGGVPRSGTTLMRAMLDAHPDVRCGQETRVIPRILQLRSHWLRSEKESLRLQEAGITKEVMNSAIAQFCLEIIAGHGEPAPRLCNKDPLTLKMGSYVIELFPNAKFLFMVRDGRATVHSIISRKVTITGFDLSSYRQCMSKWNHAIQTMHAQCKEIGKDRCLMVYYEQLVLHPEQLMRKILNFLEVPWNNSVLHHEEYINKPNGVPLSKVERSSDQVIKPVNLEALTKWVGQIPDDVVRDMADVAPMLSVLGYDPYSNPPDYGKPDAWVTDNTAKIKANKEMWENKAKQILHMPSIGQDTKDEKSNEDANNNNSAPGPATDNGDNNNDDNNKNQGTENNNQNNNGPGNTPANVNEESVWDAMADYYDPKKKDPIHIKTLAKVSKRATKNQANNVKNHNHNHNHNHHHTNNNNNNNNHIHNHNHIKHGST